MSNVVSDVSSSSSYTTATHSYMARLLYSILVVLLLTHSSYYSFNNNVHGFQVIPARFTKLTTSSCILMRKNAVACAYYAGKRNNLVSLKAVTTTANRASASSESSNNSDHDIISKQNHHLEVVLFGLGDLRVHDHEGLTRALENAIRDKKTTGILPMFVVDTNCKLYCDAYKPSFKFYMAHND